MTTKCGQRAHKLHEGRPNWKWWSDIKRGGGGELSDDEKGLRHTRTHIWKNWWVHHNKRKTASWWGNVQWSKDATCCISPVAWARSAPYMSFSTGLRCSGRRFALDKEGLKSWPHEPVSCLSFASWGNKWTDSTRCPAALCHTDIITCTSEELSRNSEYWLWCHSR